MKDALRALGFGFATLAFVGSLSVWAPLSADDFKGLAPIGESADSGLGGGEIIGDLGGDAGPSLAPIGEVADGGLQQPVAPAGEDNGIQLGLGGATDEVALEAAGPAGPAIVEVPAIGGPAPVVVTPAPVVVTPAVVVDPGKPVVVPAPAGPALAPVGPAMVHHFVYLARHGGYGHMPVSEFRTDLILFADGKFMLKWIEPARDYGWEKHEAQLHEEGGLWTIKHDELMLKFDSGCIDVGLITKGSTGPILRLDGRRWEDALAAK